MPCIGACCCALVQSENKTSLRAILGEQTVENEQERTYIDDMLYPISEREVQRRFRRYYGATGGVTGGGEQAYACRHWNPKTKLCKAYEQRPNMCRGYPSYGGSSACPYCGESSLTLSLVRAADGGAL